MISSQQRVTLPSGVTLPYVEHGDPAGLPVVLLHGFTDSWRSWEPLLGALPRSLHAYVPTQRGHGDADHPAHGYGLDDYVGDVAGFMDAVGVEAALIVGHSGGSYAAQRFALDHPERTLGLVLVGAFLAFRGNAAVLELTEAARRLTDPVDRAFIRAFQESCVARPVPDGFLEAIVAESAKVPARVWNAYLDGIVEAEVPTEAGTIAAPSADRLGRPGCLLPALRPGRPRRGHPRRAPHRPPRHRSLPALGGARPRGA